MSFTYKASRSHSVSRLILLEGGGLGPTWEIRQMSTEIAEKISMGPGKVLNGLNVTQLQRLVLLQRVRPSGSALNGVSMGPGSRNFTPGVWKE